MDQVAEGVTTSAVVMELGERYGIELPISYEVHRVVHQGATALEAYRGLTRQPPGAEHEPG